MRIRNWETHQHFSNRRPPWVKLYRALLDDLEFNSLSGDDVKTLILLWLLASEDKSQKGVLPDVATCAFRLRTTESKLNQALARLSHWVIQDADNLHTSCTQDGPPETETETETETDRGVTFQDFWKLYPRKKDKAAAERAWHKLKPECQRAAVDALPSFEFDEREGGQFIKYPASWLNNGSWLDDEQPDEQVHWQ